MTDVSIELEQEWEDASSLAHYLRQMADSVEGNSLLRDKSLFLHVKGDENGGYRISLETL